PRSSGTGPDLVGNGSQASVTVRFVLLVQQVQVSRRASSSIFECVVGTPFGLFDYQSLRVPFSTRATRSSRSRHSPFEPAPVAELTPAKANSPRLYEVGGSTSSNQSTSTNSTSRQAAGRYRLPVASRVIRVSPCS